MSRATKKSSQSDANTVTVNEEWTVVQVAAHLSLTYQVARNNMLSGDYGPTQYDADTRRLTVSADYVRAVKSKRGRKRIKRDSRA